ncbi:MAG: septum formation initiator family protein [Blastomonas sp.]
MARRKPQIRTLKAALAPGLGLVALLAIGGYALLGPTGVLAWGDYRQQIEQRSVELAKLEEQRDALRNRVELLDPDHVDPDLASELMRKKLNVAHPDEIIFQLK